MSRDNEIIEEFDWKETRDLYAEILEDSRALLGETNKQSDVNQRAELFGIYYNAFAGILRSGAVLHKKEMDVDGYARIELNIGNNKFVCKDTAMRDILGEDYINLIHPYEDNSLSYVHPYEPELKIMENGVMKKDEQRTRAVEKKKEKQGLFKKKNKPDDSENPENENTKNTENQKAKKKERKPKKERKLREPREPLSYQDRVPKLLGEINSISSEISLSLVGTGIAAAGIIISLLLF